MDIMDEKPSVELDPEAQRLFEQFAGLEAYQAKGGPSGKDLAESLLDEQRRHDKIRIQLVRLLSLLRYYFIRDTFAGSDGNEAKVFSEVAKTLDVLARTTAHLGFILIRYRGISNDSAVPAKYDYEISIGNTVIDNVMAARVAQRCGVQYADVPDKLLEACSVFSEYGVSNLYIDLPEAPEDGFDFSRKCLKIIAGFRNARNTGVPIQINTSGEVLVVPIINDENMYPDPNLTLMAGLNKVSVPAMETLVSKVDAWLRKQTNAVKEKRYAGIYNAALDLPKLKSRIKRPAIELNNVKWLLCDTDEEEISLEMAKLAKLVMETSGASPQKAAKVLQSIYGKDYAKINALILGERLNLSTELMNSLETRPQETQLKDEVLGNLRSRLDLVKDQVIDELRVRKHKGEAEPVASPGDGSDVAVHSRIYDMVNFYKGRSTTRKKMTGMVHDAIEFTDRDFQILAEDFRISEGEAHQLVAKLKSCFKQDGHFSKSGFNAAVPHFSKYEQKIFQFLWHHMKDVILPPDRVAFLNSLQSLTSQMDQPKRAFKILIEDICSEPEEIKFSDDKAVMLANLIVQRDKSLTDYEITPEDIVLNRHAIDAVVAEYAAWRIEKEHENFLTKVQTAHRRLSESLCLEKNPHQTACRPPRCSTSSGNFTFSCRWWNAMSARRFSGPPSMNTAIPKRPFITRKRALTPWPACFRICGSPCVEWAAWAVLMISVFSNRSKPKRNPFCV